LAKEAGEEPPERQGNKMIVVSPSDKARAIYDELLPHVSESIIDDEDLIVVIGGDGFLLGTASKYGLDKTYIPLNGGHLGYLLNDILREDGTLDGSVVGDMLNNRDLIVREFPTLSAEFDNGTSDFAINDVYVERASGQTARISIKIDGSCLVKKMVCDGTIIATPLGSTGYSYSAGGPVVHHLNRNIIVTPSNAHHPSFRPMVLPSSTKVLVTAEDTEYRPVRFVTDGRVHEGVGSVNIGIGKETLRLGYFEGHNFTRRLVQKILNRS
jgi:NAD+ kinase